MKKLFLLFTVFCIAQLTSCDDGIEKVQYDTSLSKIYRGDNLEFILNEKELNSRVSFITPDRITADIVLPYMVPGRDSLILNGVELRKTANNTYVFDYRVVDEESALSLVGELGDKLKINATHAILSPIVGKWKPFMSPLTAVIVPLSPTDSVDLKGFFGMEKIPVHTESVEVTDNSFERLLSNLGVVAIGSFPGLIKPVITLHNNSDLTATWKISTLIPDIANREGALEAGTARYNPENGRIHVAISLDKLLGTLDIMSLLEGGMEDITLEDIEALFKLIKRVQNGLPIIATLDTSGIRDYLDISITRDQMRPYIKTLVKVILPLLADFEPITMVGFTFSPENIAAFLNEFARVVEQSEEFTLIIKMRH